MFVRSDKDELCKVILFVGRTMYMYVASSMTMII